MTKMKKITVWVLTPKIGRVYLRMLLLRSLSLDFRTEVRHSPAGFPKVFLADPQYIYLP